MKQAKKRSFLGELGRAVRRGSDGQSLALFFYGYSWVLARVWAGPAETGHYALEWLLRNGRGNVDGLSSPYNYPHRNWPGPALGMSPGETIVLSGFDSKTDQQTKDAMPFLSRIWGLQWLLGNTQTDSEERQMILVVTVDWMVEDSEGAKQLVEDWKKRPVEVEMP